MKKNETKDAKSESPFKEGDCLCGIPNCKGHEVAEDGHVYIAGHPSTKVKVPTANTVRRCASLN